MTNFYIKSFKKGDIILQEGQVGNKAYIINKGNVQIVKASQARKFIVLAELGPGEIFGEMCLFDDKPRSATAIAVSSLEVKIIKKEDFLQLLSNVSPDLKIVIEHLLQRLRETSNLLGASL